MSEVVYTDSGPEVEIKIEEAATAGRSAMPTSSLEGKEDVLPGEAVEN
jgi:hypothetical protein